MDMDQMHKDVAKILSSPPEFSKNGFFKPHNNDYSLAPNFAEGLELLRNLDDLGKKYCYFQ